MSELLCESCVQAWSPGKFWFALVVCVLLAMVSFYFLWRFFHRARIVEDTPTSRLRSAAQGYVEVLGWGKEFEGSPLHAPLTHAPCLWYRYKVEEYQRSAGNDRARWKTIESGVSNYTFIVDDYTGKCVVDPEGAEVTASLKDVWTGSQRVPRSMNNPELASGVMGAALAKLGAGSRYRFTEERIVKDEQLYVLGYLETVGGHRLSFDMGATVRELIAEWKQDYQDMLARFDIDGDGRIDLEEWKQVRGAALQEAHMIKDQQQAVPDLNMIARPPGKRPFIISTREEADIVKRYRWYAGGSLLAFLLFGSAAYFMLMARL